MADEIVRLAVDSSQIQSEIAALRGMVDDELFNTIIGELTKLAGVSAEQYEIFYPPQREPLPEKPRYSKKTGKQLKPRKRKRYKRTGVLGGSLTSDAEQEALGAWIAFVGTNVEYAPYVVGMPTDDPGQAWFHQNYWNPLETQLTQHLPDIIAIIQARLTYIVQGLLSKK